MLALEQKLAACRAEADAKAVALASQRRHAVDAEGKSQACLLAALCKLKGLVSLGGTEVDFP